MIQPTLTRQGKTRPIKNLGWLLRNWRQVESFRIEEHPPVKYDRPEAVLVAVLREDGEYRTGYCSAALLLRWLDRPVFRGVPQVWLIDKPELAYEDNP